LTDQNAFYSSIKIGATAFGRFVGEFVVEQLWAICGRQEWTSHTDETNLRCKKLKNLSGSSGILTPNINSLRSLGI